MIKGIEIEIKGDFNSMIMKRDSGSNIIEMQFHYSNGCRYASFNFEDMKTAIELLANTEAKGFTET